MPSLKVNISQVMALGCETIHFLLLTIYAMATLSLITKYQGYSSETIVLAIILIIWPSISLFLALLGHEVTHLAGAYFSRLHAKIIVYQKKGSILILTPNQIDVGKIKQILVTLSGVLFNLASYITICTFLLSPLQDMNLELTIMLLYFALTNFILIIDSLNLVAVGNDLYLLLRRFKLGLDEHRKKTSLAILKLLSYLKYIFGLGAFLMFIHQTCNLITLIFSIVGTLIAFAVYRISVISRNIFKILACIFGVKSYD